MMNENFDILRQLLGSYLHQDWPCEFETDVEAIRTIVETEPHDLVVAALREVEKLLSTPLSESNLRWIMENELGCYFDPIAIGMSYKDWLERVREILSGSLNTPDNLGG